MFIKKVSMVNFGNVEEQTLHFSKGINLFSGNNGEGKSTVLRAITLLLFNHYVGKLEDYVNWNNPSEPFNISMEFSHLDIDYLIEHKYSSKKSHKKLTNLNNGEVLENSSVMEYLDNTLDIKRAVSSIVSFENNIDLISTSPSERREYLKGIYNLNFKEKIKMIDDELLNSKDDILSLSQKKDVYVNMEFKPFPLVRQPFSETVYKDKVSEESILRESIYNLKNKHKTIKAKENKLEELKYNLYKLENKNKEIDKEIEEKNLELKELEDKIANMEEFSTKDLDLKLKEKNKELKVEIKELENEKTKLNENLDSLEIPIFEPTNEELEKQIDSQKEERAFLNSSIRSEKQSLSPLEEGVCPTCGQEIDDTYLEKAKDKIEKDTKKLEEVENKIRELMNLLTSQVNKMEEFSRMKQGLNDNLQVVKEKLNRKNFTLDNLNASYENEVSSARNTYNLNKDKLNNRLELYKDRIEQKKETKDSSIESIKSLNLEISELEEEIKGSTFDPELLNLKEKELFTINEDIKKYEEIISENKTKRIFNEEQEEKKKERDEKVKELDKEIEKAHEIKEITTLSKNILLREFPSFVISRMVNSLKNYVNEFLEKVYPKYTITLEEDRSAIKVLFGPNKADVKLASGFEQQVFSFAWKYALGKIQNYNLLILDEIDSSASLENSMKLYDTLAKMDDYFKQIFVVSHKPEIQELLSNDYLANVYSVEKGFYNNV